MNKFYSSLVINSKNFPDVHQVFKPRYNKEFFKRLAANVDQLDSHIEKRSKGFALDPTILEQSDLKNNISSILKLRQRLEKLEKSSNENEVSETRAKLETIEDRVMPLAVLIPNRFSKFVPSEDIVLEKLESDFISKQKLSKVLNHTKLSYINNCYSKSVVGPNSHYYFGIGAKLQYALGEFFADQLERQNFISTSGLCLTKSAVVEATNSSDLKDFAHDPCRILPDEPRCTAIHSVEASRESLFGFLTTIGPRVSNNSLKLFTSGAGYRNGSNWFDSDDKRVSQFQTLHAMIMTSSIEQYSMKEYHEFRSLIWDIYKQFEIPIRLVQCSLESMLSNEYDAHRIDVWLPSRQQWIQVSRISHYLDYLTVRAGMKRGHIIDSMVYDGQALAAAIIENRQTSTGKFIIPSVVKNYMIHLSDSEADNYFKQPSNLCDNLDSRLQQSASGDSGGNTYGVLSNYEQRRYLVKKNYVFGHSRKAFREQTTSHRSIKILSISFSFVMLSFLDWTEIYIQYVPTGIKRFYYDCVYRPLRRFWWYFVFPTGVKKPDDLAFDALDHSDWDKTMFERRKELVQMPGKTRGGGL